MAAGGSAPELFTSLIGATVESDVGFSTIVGSAVFNVLFVIGLCGYFAKEEMVLTWWPLFRDCTYYVFGLILLAVFASDGKIILAEAIVLFVAYILYCIIMYYNERVEHTVDTNIRKSLKQVRPADSSDDIVPPAKVEPVEINGDPEVTPEITPEGAMEEATVPGAADAAEDNADDDDDEDPLDFIKRPEGTKDIIVWAISMPVYAALYLLTPPPTAKWYIFTFITSLLWIAGFSFFLVWWVEILGDIVFRGSCSASVIMGFTILAAGTSIPDAVSSVAVAMKGEGDMAVSSSIGSNIFDILVGLPIPWMLKIIIATVNSEANPFVLIGSPFLFFYVVLLLFMVIMTVGSIHMLGWRLTWKLGAMMAALYVLFLLCALGTEFGRPTWLQWGGTNGPAVCR